MKEVPNWVAGVLILGILAVVLYPPRFEVSSTAKGGIVRNFAGWHPVWKAPEQPAGDDARPVRYEFHTTYLTLEILAIAVVTLAIAALAGKRKTAEPPAGGEEQTPPQAGP